MAISIDWGNRIINVPRSDLTLIQATPTEIRELDLNTFRLTLKDLEDDAVGMIFPDTHRHNTEVLLAGLTYARVIEIINGYTVTFEDGQYAVNLVGANSNVGDVVNVNHVSVRVSNSAGMISSPEIQYASYNGGVTIDVGSSYAGTIYPIGTVRQPVNNLSDALLIAILRGFNTFYILGDVTLDGSQDFTQYTFIGESTEKTTITVENSAITNKCEFYECTLTGTLDGECKVKNSVVNNVTYISGYVELCVISGVVELGGGATAYFLDCWAGSLLGQPPAIDMGGSGQTLVMQNFNGYIKIRNKSGNDQANFSLNAGWIVLENTVTDGTVTVIGVGTVEDYSIGTVVVDTSRLLSVDNIPLSVFSKVMSGSNNLNFEQIMEVMTSAMAGKSSGGGTTNVKFRNLDDDTDVIDAIVDENGNRTLVDLNV